MRENQETKRSYKRKKNDNKKRSQLVSNIKKKKEDGRVCQISGVLRKKKTIRKGERKGQ